MPSPLSLPPSFPARQIGRKDRHRPHLGMEVCLDTGTRFFTPQTAHATILEPSGRGPGPVGFHPSTKRISADFTLSPITSLSMSL